MELLVATWTLRIAIVGALAVTGVSISAGVPVLEAADRGMFVAVAFTFAGRWFLRRLESPERRLLRLRRQRAAKRGGGQRPRSRASKAAGSSVSRAA